MTRLVLRLLLRLSPSRFRDRYGAEILETHAQRASEPRPLRARVRFAATEVAGLVVAAVRFTSVDRDWARRHGESTRSLGDTMLDILHDVRFSFRALRRNPGYTLVAILTLALGIGANTAIFSLVHGVLLRPLPYDQPDRLVRAYEVTTDGRAIQAAWRNFTDWREQAEGFSGMVAHSRVGQSTVLGAGPPIRTGTVGVSEGFLRLLGVIPVAGRDWVAEEHVLGADPGVIVSHGFWTTYLGADPVLSNHRVEVAGFGARVVGVAPPGFDYPSGADVWYPLELTQQSESRTAHNYIVVARLADGVDPVAADRELDLITARFLEADPGAAGEEGFEAFFPVSARVESLRTTLAGDSTRPLLILLGASAMLLLVACTNLASTGLARGTGRSRELAVRRALGADSGRLLRLLFAESITLAGIGAGAGLLLAAAILRAVPFLAPDALPPFASFGLDPAVLAFTLIAAALTAVLFGLAPSLRFSRVDPAESIKAGAGSGKARTPLWRFLVASEVAMSLVLMIGCGLLIRSFVNVLQIEPGFETRDVMTATLNPPATKYPDRDARARFYERTLTELQAAPGVETVGLIASPPMSSASNGLVDIDDGPLQAVSGDYHLVSREAFGALGISLVRGRGFDGTERPETEHLVVVNETFAELAWPGDDPIGKRMTGGGMDNYWNEEKWATVIGVVADARLSDLTREAEPAYYFSYAQRPQRSWSMTAIVRPEGVLRPDLGAMVRDIVRSVDSDVPVTLSTMETRVGGAVAERRFTLFVLGAFAVVALLLACIGIYGVVAYAVALRTREIGIRIALGARPSSVRRLVQRDTLVDVLAGGAAGVVLAVGLTRVMQNLLYEVSPTDPLTFLGVVAALATVGWLAASIPAARSTRIDPVTTMRSD